MAGFFKIQREYLESSEWLNRDPFDVAKAWIDIVGRANYAEGEWFYKGKYQRVHRGQLATSEVELANRWNWSRGRVRRFLCNLIDAARVTVDKSAAGTLITVINYDIYQDKRTRKSTTDGATNEHQTDITRYTDGTHKKKNKKNKEYPNGYIYPSRADIAAYVSEKGLAVDPDEIFDYYEAVGWEINGKPIKDWKAVCRRWKSYEKPKPEQSQEDHDAEVQRLLDIMEQGGSIYDATGSS